VSNSVTLKRRDMTRTIRVAALICATMGLILLAPGPQERLYANPNETGTKTVVIPIEGMSCPSCVARVKRTLTAIEGVVEVHVELAQRSARIRYIDGRVTPDRLTAAINNLGYKAGIPQVEGVK
jgi:copper chaperone CopZ